MRIIKGIVKNIFGENIFLKIKHFYFLLVRRKNAIINFGFSHRCPICKSRIRNFKPGGLDVPIITKYNVVGAGYFSQCICPVCYSFNRDRLLFLFLQRMTTLFNADTKLIHIAPEKEIQNCLKKHKNINYLSIDLDSPLADIKMDITDMKLADENYDVVICNHVLEHIEEDIKAMKEIFRILVNGGWAILQVPISYEIESTYEDNSIRDSKEREIQFGQKDHVRIYGKDYFERLSSVGFIVNTVSSHEFLNDEEIKKYSVIENEKIIICKKFKH